MINRPNKVFYLARELNFIESAFTIESYKESFLKALVSGFGPYPIVSVKVVDKVATVDIGEKARLYGGVKISLEGTGVTAIDTWHEIDTVKDNTFTFNVDAPNGEYTNGITMGYPSLGWTLSDRDANNFLFRSGPSASTDHYVRISFNRDRPVGWADEEKWRNTLIMEKVECDGTLNSIRMVIPKDYNVGIFLVIEISAPLTIDHNWFFYGDDAFVTLGHKGYWNTGNLYTRRANMWNCMFGELCKSMFKNGPFFLNGLVNPNSFWSNPYINGHTATTAGYGGLLAGTDGTFHESFIAATTANEKNSYMDQVAISTTVPLWGDNARCGFNFDRHVTKYVNNNLYGNFTAWNRNYEHLGNIPGIIAPIHMPNMTPAFKYMSLHNGRDEVESIFKPVTLLGQYKGRKTYAYYSSGYNQTAGGTGNPNNIYWPWQSTCIFDLTGPIR